MSKIKLKEIADAIREKDGTTELIVANDFATRIRALPSGKYNLEVTDEDDGTQSWNLTDWDYVPPLVFDPVFANNSWTQIARVSEEIVKNNYTSTQVKEIFGWDLLTDTKDDIGVDGKTRKIGIAGFNHDDLSNGSGKAGITFRLADFEPSGSYQMNNVIPEGTTQPIGYACTGGYPTCKMRNENLPTILLLLSEELQSVIKEVNKLSANGGTNTYTETVTTKEKLFIPSAIEANFSTAISTSNSGASHGETEGSVYEYWSVVQFKEIDVDKNKYIPSRSCTNNDAVSWNFQVCSVERGNYSASRAHNSFRIIYMFCI